ncbi:MAG: hypothetical protein K6A89_01940 [Treponema sp.]|nr:hypothetical protein [Treponema sp.]
MNTIPLTFNEHQIKMNILGGLVNNDSSTLDVSVILLNTMSNLLKPQIFDSLIQCNFRSIVSIEHNRENANIEDLSKKYPLIKFLIPLEESSEGQLINLAMSEVDSTYVLVLRDTIQFSKNLLPSNLAERLIKANAYCIVPRLLDSSKNPAYGIFTPGNDGKKFAINESSTVTDGMKTIYPPDFIALYNRKKFISLGGYDWTIKSPYWQNLDLSIRSWLWGEETLFSTTLQFTYLSDFSVPDKTVNLDYIRYYLKNELPKLKMETGIIKKSSFFVFLNHSSCGIMEAKRQFNEARKWVQKNKYRFKKDLTLLLSEWGVTYEK